MLYHKYKPLAARVYCTGLALLLVLSEVFSSNVQDTLPGFSRIMRLGLTGCAVLLRRPPTNIVAPTKTHH